jgi:hypothetical protein
LERQARGNPVLRGDDEHAVTSLAMASAAPGMGRVSGMPCSM